MWVSMEDMIKQKKNATFGGRLKMAREDAERHARTVARLRAEIDNQGAEIGRLEAAQRREAESGTRRERLLDVLQNGAAILESAAPTAANAWLRAHLRIWSDGAALLVDWSLDWRPV